MAALAPLIISLRQLHHYDELQTTHALADWIEARVDEGLTWFCLAPTYGDGEHQARFGQALFSRPGLSSRVNVMVKAGIVPAHLDTSGRHVKHYDTGSNTLAHVIDHQLEMLNLERIELFHLHRPDPLMDHATVGHVLDEGIASGKLGHIGVSHFLPAQWRRLQTAMSAPLRCGELELSIPRSEALFDGLWDAMCVDNIMPLACSPLCGGRLFESLLGSLLAERAQDYGVSAASLAMAWLNTLPHAPTPVVGTLKPAHLRTLLDHASLQLDRVTWFELLEAARAHRVF
ncbi:aldo/keto reductase [Larsenimonas salina]|uniref:aldo/keto reductase n=1 Tax=Larsenimonas salina TaxID=1295565 RepID=UPI0020730BB7|nr:aldo/keto reductase [Larsenimonas salina]MCM5704997.1 aldo/keto reductase [Larsenimonas salina]